MSRKNVFISYKDHPWLKRVFKRLSEKDINFAMSFIDRHDSLGKGEFEKAVNRIFIDVERPKHYKEILELLSCSNSSLT